MAIEKMIYDNGCVYEGEVSNGVPHGKGKAVFANGDIYEGDFDNGKYHGEGCYSSSGGAVRSGEWKNNKHIADGGALSQDAIDELLSGEDPAAEIVKKIPIEGEKKKAQDLPVKSEAEYIKAAFTNALNESGALSKNLAEDSSKTMNEKPKDHITSGFTGRKGHTFPNGSVYYGDWVNGIRSGWGRLTAANGEEYTGDYFNDERHGKGKYKWPDGREYSGDWVNGQRTGKGKETDAEGAVYEGDFLDGLYHGEGKYTEKFDRSFYEGSFLNGKRNGKGKYTNNYYDGWYRLRHSYEGDWVDDKKHGKGKEIYNPDKSYGDSYEGDFVNDERTGKGIEKRVNGLVYEGEFFEGSFHGKGTIYYSDGITDKSGYKFSKGDIYEGDWVYGNRTGKGKITYHDGRVLEGNWKDDKLIDGLSKEEIENLAGVQKCYINGELYDGNLFNEKFTGNGKYVWSTGMIYEGDWVNGKFHGKGKFSDQHGNIYEGDFVDHMKHGKGKDISFLGHIYEGDFAFNDNNGKGKFISPDYYIYEGDFVSDDKYGKGKQIFNKGGSYEGIFLDDKYIGSGVLTYPDGKKIEGEWKKGKFYIKNGISDNAYCGSLSMEDIKNIFYKRSEDDAKTEAETTEKNENDSDYHVFTRDEINELLVDYHAESHVTEERKDLQTEEQTEQNRRTDEQPLYDFQENRQIRIFISSTFRDMMKERDYLITKTFPELRRYCDDRDISLFELDLRWGVTQEESENALVFKICLNEVDNTMPFFIGLLGERYGWIPDKATIEKMKPTNVFDEYQWLLGELQKQKSVTETEMFAGAFIPDQKINAFFYIRSPEMETPDEFREEKGSHGEKMLLELKERIRNDSRYDTSDYKNVEHLGRLVEADFKKLVDSLFPERKQLTDLEKERMQQHVYLKSKTRTYVENPQWMDVLDKFSDGKEKVLAITGERGMGKASLLASWIASRQKKQMENEKIIYHFTGMSNSEGDYNRILNRFKNELKDFTGSAKDDFRELLKSVPENKKLIIAVDSLDSLDDKDNAKMLNWIPEDFPLNVKMIFTTVSGDKSEEPVKRRAGITLTLDSLPLQIKNELVKKYFEKYSKKLTAAQTEKITSDAKSGNPAVLTALLDNLRVFGQFDSFDKQISGRLARKNNETLFDLFLDDIESVFNDKNMVKNILSVIALSRRGLTETEILNISKIAPLYWSQLSNCMSLYLTTVNGFVAFSSGIMLNAVKDRYLKDEKEIITLRRAITKYLETGDDVLFNRKCDELPFQYMELKDWDKLYALLLDYKVFNYIYAKDPDETVNLWRALLEQDEERYTVYEYRNIFIEKKSESDLAPFFENSCILFLNILSDVSMCLYFSNKYLKSSLTCYGYESRQTAASYNCIGRCYIKSKEYNKAIEYFNKAVVICNTIYENIELCLAYGYLAQCYSGLGEYAKAVKYYDKAVQISKNIYGEENVISARYYSETASCYINSSEYEKASIYYNKAFAIQEKILGKEHSETINTLKNIEELGLIRRAK
ncbi:MAG: tetratricopeptide repeat protein [Treponema sp.]|nr:tetratricopeptide repeat protein [Treponema sp.]